jgi:hypothetical protein
MVHGNQPDAYFIQLLEYEYAGMLMDYVPIVVVGLVLGWLLRILYHKTMPFSLNGAHTVLGKLSIKAYGGVDTHLWMVH